eukprot:8940401-Pyramimonas_sp.AAC.1
MQIMLGSGCRWSRVAARSSWRIGGPVTAGASRTAISMIAVQNGCLQMMRKNRMQPETFACSRP